MNVPLVALDSIAAVNALTIESAADTLDVRMVACTSTEPPETETSEMSWMPTAFSTASASWALKLSCASASNSWTLVASVLLKEIVHACVEPGGSGGGDGGGGDGGGGAGGVDGGEGGGGEGAAIRTIAT
eukprot:4300041-Prymnesium_polylepis.1